MRCYHWLVYSGGNTGLISRLAIDTVSSTTVAVVNIVDAAAVLALPGKLVHGGWAILPLVSLPHLTVRSVVRMDWWWLVLSACIPVDVH